MLACLDRGSRTLLAVQAANRFGISVLHDGQEPIARAFATKAPVAEKWQGVAWSERDGIPAIDDALVWVACELRDVIAAGDHVIVTGEVSPWRPARAPRSSSTAASTGRWTDHASDIDPPGVWSTSDARQQWIWRNGNSLTTALTKAPFESAFANSSSTPDGTPS